MIKILIVDDEKPICDLIDMNLSAAGYQCTAALNVPVKYDVLPDYTIEQIVYNLANGNTSRMICECRKQEK